MDLGLAGKRAVVTGASKGIGLAVAQYSCSRGRSRRRGIAQEFRRVKATGRFGTRIRCSNRPSVSRRSEPTHPGRPRWRADRHPHQQRWRSDAPDWRIGIRD